MVTGVVTVFLHQVNTEAHPSVPPGWRWAVHLGGNPHDLDACMNAGWCPDRLEAALEGEMVGVTVAKAVSAVTGVRWQYRVTELNLDPIAAGEDFIFRVPEEG
jgi:hypothetical protein